jgi:hypothetical protein
MLTEPATIASQMAHEIANVRTTNAPSCFDIAASLLPAYAERVALQARSGNRHLGCRVVESIPTA